MTLAAVSENGYALQFVKNQTDEIALAAVSEIGYALQFVKNQTDEIALAAVRNTGRALSSVKNKTPEILLAAVSQNGLVLRSDFPQTQKLALAAVFQNGLALQYVKNQDPEIALTSVLNNGDALEFVINQTPEIILAATTSYLAPIVHVKKFTEAITLSLYKSYGVQFLFDSVRKGRSEVIKTLMENNVPVDIVNLGYALTPFQVAALSHNEKAVQLLFDFGANTNLKIGKSQANILSYMISNLGRSDIERAIPTIITLLNIGIDPLELDFNGRSATMNAQNKPKILQIIKAFNIKKLVESTIKTSDEPIKNKTHYF